MEASWKIVFIIRRKHYCATVDIPAHATYNLCSSTDQATHAGVNTLQLKYNESFVNLGFQSFFFYN